MKNLADATVISGGAMIGAVAGTIYSVNKNMKMGKSVVAIGVAILLGAGAAWAVTKLMPSTSTPETTVADDL